MIEADNVSAFTFESSSRIGSWLKTQNRRDVNWNFIPKGARPSANKLISLDVLGLILETERNL